MIRVESDFKIFDHLIKFINNDIFIAKELMEKMISKRRFQSEL
jgi:hypothetical protein